MSPLPPPVSYFVVGSRADGTEKILTSHATREAAEKVLNLLSHGHRDYVEFRILTKSTWPPVSENPQPLKSTLDHTLIDEA
jgi:hypothetical protein